MNVRFLGYSLILFFSLLLLSGVLLNVDSVIYVEGAINVLRGKGFVTSCNLRPIDYFQPLFSYYLIPFIALFGLSGFSILIANSVLFIVLGICCFRQLYTGKLAIAFSKIDALAIFGLIATAYVYDRVLMSENLNLIFTFFYFAIIFEKCKLTGYWRIVVLLALEILMIETKNQSILLIVPYHIINLISAFRKDGFNLKKYLPSIIHSFSIAAIFLIIRIVSDDGSHVFKMGSGVFAWYRYIGQIITDLAHFLFGYTIGNRLEMYNLSLIAGLVVAFASFYWMRIDRRIFSYIIIALALHVFVFSNVFIDSELRGRFLGWMYMAVFIFAAVRYKFSVRHKKTVIAILLLIFVGGKCIDVLMFNKKNYHALVNKDAPYDWRMYYYYQLSDSTIITTYASPSRVIKTPDGSYKLLSPCYMWDVEPKRKNKD